VLARATRLASPAGRALADHLRRGHVDPPGRMLLGKIVPRMRRMWPSHPTGEVGLVALDGPPPDPASLGTLALSLPDPFLLAGHVHRFAARLDMGLWPTALPAHPEALAAHALIALCDLPESTGSLQTRSLVTALPGLDGPIGPAVALAVAYSLGAQDPPDRTAGADAVVGLAGRGEAGGPVGAVVAELVTRTGLKVGRVAGALAEASRAGPGVAEFVWQLAATALPTLLERGVRDTHRLVAVAADAAALIGARDRVDGLAEVAALGGSSRLVTEARRLDRVLTG
jgi:hypothetical protein